MHTWCKTVLTITLLGSTPVTAMLEPEDQGETGTLKPGTTARPAQLKTLSRHKNRSQDSLLELSTTIFLFHSSIDPSRRAELSTYIEEAAKKNLGAKTPEEIAVLFRQYQVEFKNRTADSPVS